MPVYLCQPGKGSSEPWRHGIQVYAAPFEMNETAIGEGGRDAFVLPASSAQATTNWSSENNRDTTNSTNERAGGGGRGAQSFAGSSQTRNVSTGATVRRVRHSEVVLVDDTCIAFGRYWLRLRWPGHKGGFAGYIALGKVDEPDPLKGAKEMPQEIKVVTENEVDDSSRPDESFVAIETSGREQGEEDRVGSDEMDNEDPEREEEPQDVASTRSSEPFESTSSVTCLRTGLVFPSSTAMNLLPVYDDGFSPPVSSAPLPSEPVFCRICREGLHDDADQEQPSPAMENDDGDRGQSASPSASQHITGDDGIEAQDENEDGEPRPADPTNVPKGPVLPHPTYHPNPHAAENPMLAPCECSGSMAFVHYMCVEQWRCRSRHPEARQGLQCETCNTPYMLPPPSARPANVMQVDNEDWLEAMPPHVMAALRQPHIWWQIGAAIVRRRWLRPIAPVLMSPIVALYCRARRLLKKKGVARRRWACSLCRRRARWKCVRCLRSYYCSRQCQNVSWHIVHKHVCYKPSRWGWSVVVYGCVTLSLFPGILRDPLMYDLGLGFVPASFYVMAILGGGIATLLKKSVGVDLRGRAFEMTIILLTIWLVLVCWGLVGAFFGDTSKCHGTFGGIVIANEESQPRMLRILRKVVMKPAEKWFLMWDRLILNSGQWVRRVLCTQQEHGCFENLHKANADFFFDEHDGAKCASDLSLVSWLFSAAGLVAAGNNVWKRRERQRRAARRPRPHQD